MRLLHVSDWHIGRMTWGVARSSDLSAVFDQILAHARAVRPDLIVHTGDLFDVSRPRYDDVELALHALQELAVTAPVVVLCGNHDSPALFRIFRRLLGERSRIRFVDKARAPEDGGVLTFESGPRERIRLAALPFVPAHRAVLPFDDVTTWASSYADIVRRLHKMLGRALLRRHDPTRDVLLLSSHVHVHGALLSQSERPLHVSDVYATHLDALPPVAYAAFGHIHKPQALAHPTVPARYAGSPIPLDFGELHDEKSLVLVEALPGQPAVVTTLPLTAGRPLWRFTGTLDELAVAARQVDRALALVTVHTETPVAELSERVRELLPHANVLQVQEVCASRQVAPLLVTGAEVEREPGFEELLHEYLVERGTRRGDAATVLATFAQLLAGEDVAVGVTATAAPDDTDDGPAPTMREGFA